MTKILSWSDPASVHLIARALRADNSLVVGTSDTVLGFLAPLSEHGRMFLDETKGRSDKPYIILFETFAKAAGFVDGQALTHLERFKLCWPGPLTLIFRAKKGLPACMQSAHGTVALRVPKHAGLLSLLAEFQGLFSTSANKSGQPVQATIEALDKDLFEHVSYCIADDQTPSPVPSTILDCTGDAIVVIREGAYALSEIERLCGIKLKKQ